MKYHRHKFNAIQTIRDGIKFASKKEAAYYDRLKIKQKAGTVLFFLRQTAFHLPGNITYRTDFQVFKSDGTVHFVDVKGFETKEFKIKKKMVESIYPVKIEIV